MAKSRASHWQRHVKRWKASGLSRAVYSAKHGFTPQTLGVWIRRIEGRFAKKVGMSKRFVAVKVAASTPAVYGNSHGPSVRIAFPDGTIIETSDGDLTTVARLVDLLRGRAV